MRYVVNKCHFVLQYFAPKCPQNAGTFQKILRRSIPTDPPPRKQKSNLSLQKCDVIFDWHTKIPRSAPVTFNVKPSVSHHLITFSKILKIQSFVIFCHLSYEHRLDTKLGYPFGEIPSSGVLAGGPGDMAPPSEDFLGGAKTQRGRQNSKGAPKLIKSVS